MMAWYSGDWYHAMAAPRGELEHNDALAGVALEDRRFVGRDVDLDLASPGACRRAAATYSSSRASGQ